MDEKIKKGTAPVESELCQSESRVFHTNINGKKVDFQRIADVMRKAMQQDPLRFKNL